MEFLAVFGTLILPFGGKVCAHAYTSANGVCLQFSWLLIPFARTESELPAQAAIAESCDASGQTPVLAPGERLPPSFAVYMAEKKKREPSIHSA